MADTLKPTIIGVEEERIPTTLGSFKSLLKVSFTVGNFGPYTLQLDPDFATKDEIIKAVRERAATIKEILSLTL